MIVCVILTRAGDMVRTIVLTIAVAVGVGCVPSPRAGEAVAQARQEVIDNVAPSATRRALDEATLTTRKREVAERQQRCPILDSVLLDVALADDPAQVATTRKVEHDGAREG